MTDRKELLEQAYELAEYISEHPAERDLYLRVARLTGKRLGDPDLEPVVEEVANWLLQFEAQGKE